MFCTKCFVTCDYFTQELSTEIITQENVRKGTCELVLSRAARRVSPGQPQVGLGAGAGSAVSACPGLAGAASSQKR